MNLIILDRDNTLVPDEFYFECGKPEWKHIMPINHKLIRLIRRHFPDSIIFIITNQAAVALGICTEKRVNEINNYLISYLKNEGLNALDHNYCPYVDTTFAKKTGKPVNINYVKDKTERKPSPIMVDKLLKKHKYKRNCFEKIIVFGDRHEDKGLAKNLKAHFVKMEFDTSYKELEKMIKVK